MSLRLNKIFLKKNRIPVLVLEKMIKNKRVFITGGVGFIGNAIKERLEKDNEVIIFDKQNSQDILNKEQLKESMDSVDIVFHLAAVAGANVALNYPKETMETNLIGTYNVLNEALRNNVERFVFSSTSEVYGANVYLAREDQSLPQGRVDEVRWMYGLSKLACENLIYSYFLKHKLKCTILRYFNVYGEGQDTGKTGHAGAMGIFIRNALQDKPILVHDDGTQIHTWCHISDIVDGTLIASDSEKGVGQIFNIGNPYTAISIIGLAKMVIDVLNSSSEIKCERFDKPDIKLRVPSIEKIKNLLGYSPKVYLKEGILRTAKWIKEKEL